MMNLISRNLLTASSNSLRVTSSRVITPVMVNSFHSFHQINKEDADHTAACVNNSLNSTIEVKGATNTHADGTVFEPTVHFTGEEVETASPVLQVN
ncbi:uncharacterized protein ASCRUDRAFT_74343 [Ascoidea rubescens DSM 1968]|uniref:Uncharacterized protein n=1 Tax=Ascoidea rubescens DSM 1968 TaxID=1344418 RepID=A0A1D2VMU5_9ASCO|nr:hypothetical protein ASCRUDRAFT_74343 [Ascoidea rubescens DSM 1968]ODV62887.1 hypothetical protein ASCRUDRAFT_74343 [Ascoidea rubescens DSM 1968]